MKSIDPLLDGWQQTLRRAKDSPAILNRQGEVLRKFHDIDERARDFEAAIQMANATAFGLTGAIHTFNSNRIEQFIARYRAGLVSINGPTYGAGPHMPFGGVKNSGNGFREPGTEALDVYCEWKTIVVNHDPERV